ncbi:MAG: cbb3-type cytochrome c oxidase subunit I [Dehalococcoidales bacterium]
MQAEAINPRLVKFIWAAAIFFAWTCIQGVIQEQEAVREFIHLVPTGGMISGAHSHIGCMGWTALALAAAIYYLAPIFSGKSIVWPKLIEWVFWIWVVGSAVGNAMLITAGIIGGNAFVAGITDVATLMAMVTPYLILMGICAYLEGVAGLMFVVHILVSLTRGARATG